MIYLLLLFSSIANSAPTVKNLDQSTYEAITGESADEDKSFWDTFYKQKDGAFGKDAEPFLKENLSKIPKGKAFVPAMGEGRNAIYLAKNGFQVYGNDISEVAIDKTMVLAKKNNVVIKSSVIDLKQYKFIENQFDLVFLSLYYDRSLIADFKKTIKTGGYIIVYQEIYDGDPKKAPSLFWVKTGELKEVFKDFKITVFKEIKDKGKKMVGVVAQKT